MSRAPSLFISHGSPMFSIEPGELGPNLRQLGRTLADLSAIVVVSPHWQTQGVRSEEHTSELQSLMRISYAVFCLNKKKTRTRRKKPNKITNTITEKEA